MGTALAPLPGARRRLAARPGQGRRDTSGLGSDKERCPSSQLTSGLTQEEVTASGRAEAVTGTPAGEGIKRDESGARGVSSLQCQTPSPSLLSFPLSSCSQCLCEPELGAEAKPSFGSQETPALTSATQLEMQPEAENP